MSDVTASQRLVRPLAVVIGVLLVAGVVGAVAWDDGRTAVANALGRSRDGRQAAATTTTTEDPSLAPAGARAGDPAATTTTVPTLSATLPVPVAGEYRYDVQLTRDGQSETVEELRSFVRLDGDEAAGSVQLEIRTGDQRQISILDWEPGAIDVRSTRVPTTVDEGSDCLWNPAFREFGPLEPSSSWTVDSTCTANVGGVPTTFHVTGSALVVGAVDILVSGQTVRVWRIERLRTTVITATIGGSEVEQRVEEQGDLYVDPARGIVVQSDVVVTTSGPQASTTRRQSTLVS